MRKGFVSALAVMVLLLSAAVPAAFAELERVGPTVTANGYPAWYQDKTGLTLEFCQPQNQAELDGGWCLLLPADTSAPEVFPTTFADEHFWYAADAAIPYALPLPAGGTSSALLVIGVEGAFGGGPVLAGDQIAFSRIRIVIRNLPYSGTYTVYHPYGTEVFENQVAGERLFVTEDIGITCAPGDFSCALLGRIGPYLLPSLTPGGAELPAVTGPVAGKLYIADPARLGPVTGSPVGQNYFRIVGPNGFDIQTSDFALMGRVFTGAIAGRVTVDRTSYTRTATAQKVDVFATAFETTQGRLPANPKPPAVTPILAFYNAACGVDPVTGALTAPAGLIDVQMFGTGSTYWGQSQPAAIPPQVCVVDETARDANGQVVPAFFQRNVTDEVSIAEALYDPANGSLSVKASSSDKVSPLTLTLAGFNLVLPGLSSGDTQFLVMQIVSPPAKVRVVSSRDGIGELQVTTGIGTPSIPGVPVAVNDEKTINEDSGATTINVLANDSYNGSPIVFGSGVVVTIVGPPRLGTASVDTTTGNINYTPSPNASGTDGIGYTVTVGTATSSVAYITINITPVNDAPVAVNDSTATTINLATTINVLVNDTDPDGATDLASAVIVTQPAAGATVSGGAGGLVTFTATAAGTYTFTYQAQDIAGVKSATAATVTVTVSTETINVSTAEFRTDSSRLRVSGTDNVHGGQTLTIFYTTGVSGSVVGTAGTAVVDVGGAWALDLKGNAILPTGATAVRVTSTLGGIANQTLTIRK